MHVFPGISSSRRPAALGAGVFLLAASVFAAQGQGARADPAGPSLTIEELSAGLEHPWALAFLPDQRTVLITERPGRLRTWSPERGLSKPISGVPAVYAKGQGGLLDVAISPGFQQDRRVCFSYAESGPDGLAGTAVACGALSRDQSGLDDVRVIFQQEPKLSRGEHFGSRLAFDGKGHLFVALGENHHRSTAQDLDKLQGKVVRIMPDGSIPPDNPFVGQAGIRPEIWSYGHRNQQGAAINPWSGELWTTEHGPRGGDEVNIPAAGRNYGWPLATYGKSYGGGKIPESRGTDLAGMELPIHYWKVSPAVSGMAFYDADRFPAWRGSLFLGALQGRELIRLQLEGDRIVDEERLLGHLGARIRDVRTGPDGYLYVLTDEADGKLLKIGLRQQGPT